MYDDQLFQLAAIFESGESTEYAGKCIVHLATGKNLWRIIITDYLLTDSLKYRTRIIFM